MQKVFNASNRTFEIKNVYGETMKLQPGKFYNVEDSYNGDPTLRLALSCNELQSFESTKQGDALEEAVQTKKTAARKAALKAQEQPQ